MAKTFFKRQLVLGRAAVLAYIAISFWVVIASEFIKSDKSYWLSAREASTVVFMLLYIPIVIGIYRNWIWAWVWACLLMIIDLYSTAFTHSELVMAWVIAFLLILSLVGTRACFKANRNAKRSPIRLLLHVVGVAVSIVLVAVFALTATADKTTLQALGLQKGSALSKEALTELQFSGILQPNERVELFFFCSSIDFRDCGTFLTDRRAISYRRIEGNQQVESLPLDAITSATIWERGSLVTPSRVEVVGNGQRLSFLMTTKGAADERFVARLKELIK